MTSLKTVERAFAVIDALWRLDGAGPAELAGHLDIPRSTAHDYLQTLETTGYVVERDGIYRLGYRFLAMGGRLKHRNRLYQIARRDIENLARDTGETANIGIEEDGSWVLLHNEKGDRSLNLGIYPGLRTPLHTHAAGKVILAHLPPARRAAVLASGLERMTADTVTDVETLRSELEEIRASGYAVDTDQQVVGMGVIAAPLLVDRSVLGSVAIVCPTGRLEDETYRRELTQKINESTDAIAINYQYGT